MSTVLPEYLHNTSLQPNSTTELYSPDTFSLQALDIFAVVVMSVIIIVAFHGNLFIIIVIFINPQLRSSMANIFIINLCIVDLLASVLAIPLSVATFVQGDSALDKEMCKVSGFVNTLVMIASMLTLCVISAERFYSIALPMHHAGHATPCMYIFVVLMTWTLSITLSVLPWIGVNSYSFRSANRICTYYWQGGSSMYRAFIISIFIISYLIPSLVLVVMYVGIFRVARKAARSVGPQPSVDIIGATNHAIESREVAVLTIQENPPLHPIFTVSSPEKVLRSLPQINIEGVTPLDSPGRPVIRATHECSLTLEDSGIRADSEIRTVDLPDGVSIKYYSVNNNKESEGEGRKSPLQGQGHRKITYSKFVCTCKKSGINCVQCLCTSTSVTDIPELNNAQTSIYSTAGEPQHNPIQESLPKSNVFIPDVGKTKSSHMKAFKTLMVIVLSYFILWSPYFICQLYGLSHGDSASDTIERIATWLGFSSYAFNSCLYGLMNRLIRDELSQLLKCVCCLCCGCNHGNRRCRRPCQKMVDDDEDEENDDVCLGGAESFYQFLQRTHASDVTPPTNKCSRNGRQSHAANLVSTERNTNNVSSDNQSNGVF